ncbi:response regulator [Hyphomonas sp. BRH_c22]|uniref:response regulator n=1 Tax=Hyphomonas sp. BRH_c22 TaxID=1629710 RepID=UPI00261883A8|nr:response regulator [Hyphomonas sp. BRH_c22]
MAAMSKLPAGLRILVVEDEMLVLMGIQDMLDGLGCDSVSAAATNEQAITILKAQHIDAALLDLNLNGVRSYPVADLLAERGVPFAFATGYGGHGLRDVDRERPLLTKPFVCDDLEKVLTGLLAIAE